MFLALEIDEWERERRKKRNWKGEKERRKRRNERRKERIAKMKCYGSITTTTTKNMF